MTDKIPRHKQNFQDTSRGNPPELYVPDLKWAVEISHRSQESSKYNLLQMFYNQQKQINELSKLEPRVSVLEEENSNLIEKVEIMRSDFLTHAPDIIKTVYEIQKENNYK